MNVYIARSVHAMLELDPGCGLRFSRWTAVRRFRLIRRSVSLLSPASALCASLDLPSARDLSKNELARSPMILRGRAWSRHCTPPDIIHAHYWLSGHWLAHPNCGQRLTSRSPFFSLRIRRLPLRMRAAAKVKHRA